MTGRDAEDAEHLIEHAAMLSGDADVSFDVCGAGSANDGRHFDGFGASAENGDDAHELFARGWSEERVRDASRKNRPIVRLDKAVPIGLPTEIARLDEGVGPSCRIWLGENNVGPSEAFPGFERCGNNDFAAGGIFDNFDLKGEVGAGGDALGKYAGVENIEIDGDFRGRDSAGGDYVVFTVGVEKGLPVVRGADDEEHGVGKARACGEESVNDEIDSCEWAVIANVADDEFVFEAEPCAKRADFFLRDAAEFREIGSIGERKGGNSTLAGEFFAEWFRDCEESVDSGSDAAQIGADFVETLGGHFIFGKPIDDIESRTNARMPVRAEEFRSIKNVSDFAGLYHGGESGAIPRLAEFQCASGTKKAMEKYRLPRRKFDESEVVTQGEHFGGMKSRARGDRKLFDAASKWRRGVHMKGVRPLQNENFEAVGEALCEFNFADGDVFGVDVRDDKKARFFFGRWRCGLRRSHFSTRKLPMTRASMPEEKKVRMASVGV